VGSVAALSYTGAVYYSVKDEEFRKVFVQHVPGAEQAVHFAEDLKGSTPFSSYSDRVGSIKKQAEGYGDVVKGYTEKAKEASSSTVEYLQDAYAKLSGQKPLPKLPSNSPSMEEIKESAQTGIEETHTDSTPQKAVGLDNNVHKEELPRIVQIEDLQVNHRPQEHSPEPKIEIVNELPAKVIEPIILSDIILDHSEIERLRRTVEHLTELLNEAKLSDHGRGAIEDADQQLIELDQKLNRILDQHQDILQNTLRATDKLETLRHVFSMINEGYTEKLYVAQKYTKGQVDQKANDLSEIFFQERAAMMAEFNAKLTKQIDEERRKFVEEKTTQLEAQNKELETSYSRQVQKTVELEAGGRFGGIDKLIARLAVLEKHAYEAALLIDRSSFSHKLAVAISALDKATDKGYMHPFSNELSALRNIANAATGTEKLLIEIVLSSIPEELEYEGVQSMDELRKRFDYLAEEVRQSSLVSTNGGMFSHMLSITLSKLMFRKHGLVPGEDVEARLARTEYYLTENDLDSAAREMNQLKGWPKKLASGWVDDARKRLEVKQVVKIVEAEISLSNLSI